MDFGYTVQDLLDSKYLRYITKVIAGKNGLSRRVSWIHILEIRDIIKECVNGDELVLTTGIGFISSDIAVNFIRELIDMNVAALCIETSLYYNNIDQQLIDIAESNDFPLIEITEISRFIDITKGLNTMIINKEAQLYNDADHFDSQLDEINSIGSIYDGIRYTADYLDIEVAYLPSGGQQYGVTPAIKAAVDNNLELLNRTLSDNDIFIRGNIAIKQLMILGELAGYLIFNSSKRNLTQFDTLILGRLSNKVEQDFIIEQLKKDEILFANNSGWIKDWLEGRATETEVKNRLREGGYGGNYSEFLVCRTPLNKITLKDSSKQLTYLNIRTGRRKFYDDTLLYTTVLKNTLEKHGFRALGYIDNDYINLVILNPSGCENVLERLEESITKLINHQNQPVDFSKACFSIGKKVTELLGAPKSYLTAVEILSSPIRNRGAVVFYDKLYISRIFDKCSNKNVLDEFISDHLVDLLEPGNADLLLTLKTYYECNCSKQRTSEKLFIVRQTLYFRLQKIEDILGKDYSEGEKRFALEFAVNAHFYLNRNCI